MPDELRDSMKSLINIKNNYNKCFLWCHIRHLHSLNKKPQTIATADKKMANDLDYKGINFPISKKDYSMIEKKNNICINVFRYENDVVYPVHISKQKFKDCMDLLPVNDENKPHYVYIKNFNRLMSNKTKHKSQKYFCRYCLQCFSSERDLIKHEEICLKVNGKQSVALKSGSIKFENYLKLIAVPFMLILNVI